MRDLQRLLDDGIWAPDASLRENLEKWESQLETQLVQDFVSAIIVIAAIWICLICL